MRRWTERATSSWALLAGLVALTLPASAFSPDFDLDGFDDDRDNCPKVANGGGETKQVDRDKDGIGDACECGDVNADGFVDALDASALDDCASGGGPCGGLCDVTGDRLCDREDVDRLDAFVAGDLSKSDFRCDQRGYCGNGVHDPGEACDDLLDPFCCSACEPRNEGQECEPDGIACIRNSCLAGRCQRTQLDSDACPPLANDCRPQMCTALGCQPVFYDGATCAPDAGCCDCPTGACLPPGPFPRLCSEDGSCVCEPGLVPAPCE